MTLECPLCGETVNITSDGDQTTMVFKCGCGTKTQYIRHPKTLDIRRYEWPAPIGIPTTEGPND